MEKIEIQREKMKQLLSDCNGMQTYLEVTDQASPAGYKYIKITSTYEKSKTPGDERVRFEMLLSPEAYSKLKDLL